MKFVLLATMALILGGICGVVIGHGDPMLAAPVILLAAWALWDILTEI